MLCMAVMQGPRVGKYTVDVKGFEMVALPQLQKAAQANSAIKLCVIDEIGKIPVLLSTPI